MIDEDKKRTRRGRRKRERGQSLVEFAMTAPILILLLVGLIEIGNGLNTYLTVLASARDAARLGSQGFVADSSLVTLVHDETDRLPNAIPSTCSGGTDAGICITHTTLSSVNTIKVKVCYSHDLLVGGMGVIPNPLPICSETAMRVAS